MELRASLQTHLASAYTFDSMTVKHFADVAVFGSKMV